jgi:hypothetical protein
LQAHTEGAKDGENVASHSPSALDPGYFFLHPYLLSYDEEHCGVGGGGIQLQNISCTYLVDLIATTTTLIESNEIITRFKSSKYLLQAKQIKICTLHLLAACQIRIRKEGGSFMNYI